MSQNLQAIFLKVKIILVIIIFLSPLGFRALGRRKRYQGIRMEIQISSEVQIPNSCPPLPRGGGQMNVITVRMLLALSVQGGGQHLQSALPRQVSIISFYDFLRGK